MFADGFEVAADVWSGDGVWESVVGDGLDGGFQYWCEEFKGLVAVDAGVLPEFGGDADETGEEPAGEDGGCVICGVGGFALDGECVAMVCVWRMIGAMNARVLRHRSRWRMRCWRGDRGWRNRGRFGGDGILLRMLRRLAADSSTDEG